MVQGKGKQLAVPEDVRPRENNKRWKTRGWNVRI